MVDPLRSLVRTWRPACRREFTGNTLELGTLFSAEQHAQRGRNDGDGAPPHKSASGLIGRHRQMSALGH